MLHPPPSAIRDRAVVIPMRDIPISIFFAQLQLEIAAGDEHLFLGITRIKTHLVGPVDLCGISGYLVANLQSLITELDLGISGMQIQKHILLLSPVPKCVSAKICDILRRKMKTEVFSKDPAITHRVAGISICQSEVLHGKLPICGKVVPHSPF